jgi:hypothetical protein
MNINIIFNQMKSKTSASFSTVNEFISVMGKVKHFQLKDKKLKVRFIGKTSKVYVSFSCISDFASIYKELYELGQIDHFIVKDSRAYIRWKSLDRNLLFYQMIKHRNVLSPKLQVLN